MLGCGVHITEAVLQRAVDEDRAAASVVKHGVGHRHRGAHRVLGGHTNLRHAGVLGGQRPVQRLVVAAVDGHAVPALDLELRAIPPGHLWLAEPLSITTAVSRSRPSRPATAIALVVAAFIQLTVTDQDHHPRACAALRPQPEHGAHRQPQAVPERAAADLHTRHQHPVRMLPEWGPNSVQPSNIEGSRNPFATSTALYAIGPCPLDSGKRSGLGRPSAPVNFQDAVIEHPQHVQGGRCGPLVLLIPGHPSEQSGEIGEPAPRSGALPGSTWHRRVAASVLAGGADPGEEVQRRGHGGGVGEDCRVGDEPGYSGEHRVVQRELVGARDQVGESGRIPLMVLGFLAKGVHQNVDVRQDHPYRSSSRTAHTASRSVRSTRIRPPGSHVPLRCRVRGRTRFRRSRWPVDTASSMTTSPGTPGINHTSSLSWLISAVASRPAPPSTAPHGSRTGSSSAWTNRSRQTGLLTLSVHAEERRSRHTGGTIGMDRRIFLAVSGATLTAPAWGYVDRLGIRGDSFATWLEPPAKRSSRPTPRTPDSVGRAGWHDPLT